MHCVLPTNAAGTLHLPCVCLRHLRGYRQCRCPGVFVPHSWPGHCRCPVCWRAAFVARTLPSWLSRWLFLALPQEDDRGILGGQDVWKQVSAGLGSARPWQGSDRATEQADEDEEDDADYEDDETEADEEEEDEDEEEEAAEADEQEDEQEEQEDEKDEQEDDDGGEDGGGGVGGGTKRRFFPPPVPAGTHRKRRAQVVVEEVEI